MKKIIFALLLIIGLVSCTEDEKTATGEIYGVVTVKETAEPMRATGVELYQGDTSMLLLKTVTYDDGHYEFDNLQPGAYTLKVVASGYMDTKYSVIVESGRTARADMQLNKTMTYLTVRTLEISVVGNKATITGEYDTQFDYLMMRDYPPNEVGFIYSDAPDKITIGKKIIASKSSTFNANIEDLSIGKWYVQAYAKNSKGTEFGNVLSFRIDGTPAVRTLPVTNISKNTATLNGSVEYKGEPAYTEKGFVYSASFPNPTIDDPSNATTKVSVKGNGTEFSANISGLTDGSTYYVRSYIMNENGTYYGESVEFGNGLYIILKQEGLMVQTKDISTGATSYDAKKMCKESKICGFSDWRLPTRGECIAIYRHKVILKLSSNIYWTQDPSTLGSTYTYNFGTGCIGDYYNDSSFRVRCVRSLK